MTITPEAFLADPAHAVGEESDPFTDLERRVSALEDLVTGPRELRLTDEQVDTIDTGAAGLLADATQELADLEAKHAVVLELIEEITGIVKKSTSKVSLEVKAAIGTWANPKTPSPAPEPSHSEPQPEPIPAAVTEASAGEGQGWWAHSTVPPQAPTHDADVEEWRIYARSLGYQGAEPDVDTMNRSQIRTLLGIEQLAGA